MQDEVPQELAAKTAVAAPKRPKKPMTPELRFAAKQRSTVKKANPDLTPEQIKAKLQQMWTVLSVEEKMTFQDQFAADEEKYKLAKAHWDFQQANQPAEDTEESDEPLTSAAPSRRVSRAPSRRAASPNGPTIECPHCHGTIHLKQSLVVEAHGQESTDKDPPEQVVLAGARLAGLSRTFEAKVQELETKFPPKELKSKKK